MLETDSVTIDKKTRSSRWAVWALVSSIAIMLPNVIQPFNNDVNVYQTMGWQLAHFHQLPYIGSWDQNFPGIVYLHAAIIWLFGTSPFAFRIVDLLFLCTQCLAVFFLSRRWFSPRFAFFAAILSATLYMLGTVWLSGQRDAFAVPLIFAATLLAYLHSPLKPGAVRGRFDDAFALLAGMLMSAAITLRPTFALYPPCLILIAILFHERPATRWLIAFIAGMAVVLLLAILPFIFVTGGLRELYLATINFNLDIYATRTYASSMSSLLHHRGELICDGILLGWLAIRFIDRRFHLSRESRTMRKADMMLFVLFYLSARVSILVMGKFFMQHYAMLMALSAFLAADIFDVLTAWLPVRLGRLVPILIVIPIMAVFYLRTFPPFFIQGVLRGVDDPLMYAYSRDPHEPADNYISEEIVVKYLLSKDVQGTRIECWGMSPAIYWRTKTASASRFTMMHPLVMQLPSGGYTDYQKRWRKEFIDSLIHVRPRFIVSAGNNMVGMGTTTYYQHALPGFDSLLNANYTVDTTFPNWTIYRLIH